MPNQTHRPNRLIAESSPYLLQHAHNPVDWYPWSEEALSLAKSSNKMILVSIGYSACHWCHVMEHESFEDEEVAALMNVHFVCIKVDREERPDVDQVFMDAVQLITGQGGWPLNCFALPDGRPVWGGTYFRKNQWIQVLKHFAQLWQTSAEVLLEQADKVQKGLAERLDLPMLFDAISTNELLNEMASQMLKQIDKRYGGQKGAPKFPMPDLLMFQWIIAKEFNIEDLHNHVLLTLERMARGGIFDQLAGGFARYSTDERWHVPHFEKMLYDNAQLIGLYAVVYRHTGLKWLSEVLERSIQWSCDELYKEGEMFCAALDADSEGEEGLFYVWRSEAFDQLPQPLSGLMKLWFGVDNEALWEHNKNVLLQPFTFDEFCRDQNLSHQQWSDLLKTGIQTLLALRNMRVRPALDDKQLLSWNALMIKGLCNAYQANGNIKHLKIAQSMADFIKQHLYKGDGGLLRTYKNGHAKIDAFLDDYAFYIQALISLYQCTFVEDHLIEARRLTSYVILHFYHPDKGLFSLTPHERRELVVQPMEVYDNVIPSSNAAMCWVLGALAIYFEDESLAAMAKRMCDSQKPLMRHYASAFFHWGQALLLLDRRLITVFKGPEAKSEAQQQLRHFLPHQLVAASEGESLIPAISSKPLQEGLWQWKCDHNGCGIPLRLK